MVTQYTYDLFETNIAGKRSHVQTFTCMKEAQDGASVIEITDPANRSVEIIETPTTML